MLPAGGRLRLSYFETRRGRCWTIKIPKGGRNGFLQHGRNLRKKRYPSKSATGSSIGCNRHSSFRPEAEGRGGGGLFNRGGGKGLKDLTGAHSVDRKRTARGKRKDSQMTSSEGGSGTRGQARPQGGRKT